MLPGSNMALSINHTFVPFEFQEGIIILFVLPSAASIAD